MSSLVWVSVVGVVGEVWTYSICGQSRRLVPANAVQLSPALAKLVAG